MSRINWATVLVVFGATLVVGSLGMGTERVHHEDAQTIGSSVLPASDTMTLSGLAFIVGLGSLLASAALFLPTAMDWVGAAILANTRFSGMQANHASESHHQDHGGVEEG